MAFPEDISNAILSCKAFPLISNSDNESLLVPRAESVPDDLRGPSIRDADRDVDGPIGDAGGGMATALGILLARGVISDGRPFEGVVDGMPMPMLETRPPGFGVLNGELSGRVGEPKPRDARVGEGIDLLGLADPCDGVDTAD